MKYVLVALLVLAAAFQVQAGSRFLVGVKGGLSFTNVEFSSSYFPEQSPKYKTGFVAGGSVEWITSSNAKRTRAGLRLDVFYVQKGWKEQIILVDERGRIIDKKTNKVFIDELVVSPLLIVRIPESAVAPYFLIGPEMGLHISAYEKLPLVHGILWNNPYAWRETPNYGLNVGAGVAMKRRHGEFSAELRYNLGLTNMTEAHSQFLRSIRTNGFQLLLGYSFDVARQR